MAVRKEMAITAAAIAAAGVLVAGVTAVSNASTTNQVANTGYAMPGQGMQGQGMPGYGGQDGDGGARGGMGQGGMGGHSHTAVTGAELAKVKAAVKAKDSAIAVTTVMKDEDGSYDVFGTKSGSQVRVEVSKDLGTVEVRTGGPGGMRGDHGAMGGHSHTAVTGTELTKVKAAVKAKDSAITVTTVMKDEDGSYDVFGTKSGSPVRVEVSKDLGTVEVRTGGPGGMHGGWGDQGTQQQAPSTGSSSSSGDSSTSTTSTI